MKKYILTILGFLAVAGATVALCLFLNTSAPQVENGTDLPGDIAQRHYVVGGLSYDSAAGGYYISFSSVPRDIPLSLTFYTRVAEMWQGEHMLLQVVPGTSSQRTYSVALDTDKGGELHLFMKTAPGAVRPGYSIKTLFTRYSAQGPKMVIGPQVRTQMLLNAGNNFYRILVGAYLMLVIACLVLYRHKPSERYLLTVCVASVFVLLYLVTAMENGLVTFSYGFAEKLSALTNVLPVSCLAYTCIGLFQEAIPAKFRSLFSLPVFLTVTAACILADLMLDIYVYQFLRRLVLFPVLVTMACALHQRLRGSRMIFLAYSVMEGITLFLYINNCILNQVYSPLLMFLRLKEVSNLVFMSACAFQIFDRFSAKFVEADHLAEEVSTLNISLEKKVAQRTRQLLQEQEHKHSMMLNVFHDLRSPIFVLRGRIAAMKAHDQEDQESLQVMETRLDYLERLTEDLFLTAKLESGDVQFDQDLVNLSALCATVLRDMHTAARSRGIELQGENSSGEIFTWGDSFRLQQAVVNLVENAITYTPQGGKVTLALRLGGERCILEVIDTGKGIPPEELSRVFERYYRAERSNKRSSGLGLFIAREIVQAHLGEIRVASEIGKGSTFTIDLPYCAP